MLQQRTGFLPSFAFATVATGFAASVAMSDTTASAVIGMLGNLAEVVYIPLRVCEASGEAGAGSPAQLDCGRGCELRTFVVMPAYRPAEPDCRRLPM